MSEAGGEPDLARLRALLFGDHARRLDAAQARIAALESAARTATPRRRGAAMLAAATLVVVLALALAWLLRAPDAQDRKAAEIDAALAAAKAADARLAAYPLGVQENWSAGTADLTGLVPSREALDALVTALTPAAAPLRLTTHVETVAPTGGMAAQESRLTALAAALSLLEGRLQAQAARLSAIEKPETPDLARRIADDEKRLGDLAAALALQESQRKAVADRLAAIEKAETPDLAARIEAVRGALAAEFADLRSHEARLSQALSANDAASKDQGEAIRRLEAGLAALAANPSPHAEDSLPRPGAEALAEAAATARGLAARVAEARTRASALAAALVCLRGPQDLPALQRYAAALVAALDAATASAAETQSALAAKAEAARRQIGQRLARKAAAEARIDFAAGDALADPAAAAATLDRLAAALIRARLGVRVVAVSAPGEAAGPARALKVADMLVKRGVPAAAAVPAAREAKPGEPAGVTFEPLAP